MGRGWLGAFTIELLEERRREVACLLREDAALDDAVAAFIYIGPIAPNATAAGLAAHRRRTLGVGFNDLRRRTR